MQVNEFVLAQSGDGSSAAGAVCGAFAGLLYLAIIVLIVAGLWKMFEKANQPGWGAIVPIYNVILLLKIAGKPLWWLVLMFIPIVNIVPAIMVPVEIAKNFGKSTGFAVGLILLPMIFYPILGFGDARYSPQRLDADMPVQTLR